MRHNARPLFCIAAIALLSGCITRTVEIRPVAPVVESRSAPVLARGGMASPTAPRSPLEASGASVMSRQESSGQAVEAVTPAGVQVEAVTPGMYSGRSLSFERDEAPK
ncbi:hypothetical protein KTQ42_22445 [Noviherbaspirillum sp. L7-7A]|uniref:hypothetical protein n=1 Tax=Noviherbaspirillum sp. L7-7A TaxID=2850560 RepID=UPI001C2BEA93|nr:hypothetical protein [Noviherbaspirillum sp. L7-7A]MBV0882042.1 hypothetical protein [Noviherbaspirillum sp. L7-7A]